MLMVSPAIFRGEMFHSRRHWMSAQMRALFIYNQLLLLTGVTLLTFTAVHLVGVLFGDTRGV